MAILSRDELLQQVNSLIGDEPGDGQLEVLENLTDTLNKYQSNVDWEQKYRENDAQWREKYRSRFLDGEQVEAAMGCSESILASATPEKPEPLTFDRLFKNGN